MNNKKIEKFNCLFKNLFVANCSNVKLESGIGNLISIRKKYYENHIKELLGKFSKEIVEKYSGSENFLNEIYDKLYNFFSQYISQDTGTIFYNNDRNKNAKYVDLFSENTDVKLFWKTDGLYYVKSERIFKNMQLKLKNFVYVDTENNIKEEIGEELNIVVDASKLNTNETNEKKELKIIFDKKDNDKYIFYIVYGNDIKKEDFEESKKLLKENNLNEDFDMEVLNIYKKEREYDYFINKNVKKFLTEQLNIFLYNYIYKNCENEELNAYTAERFNQIKIIKDICLTLIDKIAEFENELVKIWNKPKFVLNCDYVISLDRIAEKDKQLAEQLKSNQKQKQEWEQLKFDTAKETLPIDTKYYDKETKYKILSLFDNLDNETNGVLIKSDNYQALNTIKEKYKGKVKCIYIDPPYNTGSDGFLYKDGFNHSSWLTMMENRLNLARELLRDDGIIFISIDDREQGKLKLLCNEIFEKENFITMFLWEKSSSNLSKFVKNNYEYILCYLKSVNKNKNGFIAGISEGMGDSSLLNNSNSYSKLHFLKTTIKFTNIENGIIKKFKTNDLELYQDIIIKDNYNTNEIDISANFKWKQNNLNEEINNGTEIISKTDKLRLRYLRKNEGDSLLPYKSITKEKNNVDYRCLEDWNFPHPKPESLLKYLIKINFTNDNDIVLDFFSGSGTTSAVAHKMSKKYIGVEQAECFNSTIIPRMKKVIYGEQGGISKTVNWQGGGMFKYYELEQYENVLSKMNYSNELNNGMYIFDKKFSNVVDIEEDKEKININLDTLYKNIDIAETFSNILGLKIIKEDLNSFTLENNITYSKTPETEQEKIEFLRIIKPYIWW